MDTVYIVWHWKELHAVCRTKDEAERIAVRLVGGDWSKLAEGNYEVDEVDVTEHILTEVPGEMEPYSVEVLRDGTIDKAEVSPYAARWVDPGDEPRTILRRSSRMGKGLRPDRLDVQVWAPNKERAIDIAQQWRGRYIDQGRWRE
jgi:hypothetical protein